MISNREKTPKERVILKTKQGTLVNLDRDLALTVLFLSRNISREEWDELYEHYAKVIAKSVKAG